MSTKYKIPTIAEAVRQSFSVINDLRIEMEEVHEDIGERLRDSDLYIEDLDQCMAQLESVLSREPDTESALKHFGTILIPYVPPLGAGRIHSGRT